MTFSSQPPVFKPLGPGDVLSGYRAPRRGETHAGLAALNHTPSPEEKHHQALRQAAEKLVAQTFFGTLLKQMRQSPFRSEMLDGGRGGQAFSSLYNQVLSDRMANSATARKLVDSIVRRNERAAAYQKQSNSLNSARKRGSGAPAAAPASSPADDKSNPYRNVRIHVAPNFRA